MTRHDVLMADDQAPNVLGRVIDRRGALGALGLLALVGCSSAAKKAVSSTTSTTSTTKPSSGAADGSTAAATTCVITPEETEGPYGLDLHTNPELFRRDITEGHQGVPLTVTLTVLNVGGSCAPIKNARVDIWQCDADGVYSGFSQPGSNTVGETFMRGIQMTDADGKVTFDTVYPGWYQGRVTHIHYEVFLNDGLVATSQIAFPDAVTAEVYASELYKSRGQNTSVPTVADDQVFSDGTDGEMLTLTGDVASGYQGTLTVGVRS
jgi:protocatechuate 3,4-dioxygenase beta subunit